VTPGDYNRAYLRTKQEKLGHLLAEERREMGEPPAGSTRAAGPDAPAEDG
jgi:hypothetical protein